MDILIPSTLLVLLLTAAWQDIRSYRIPNGLVLTGVVIGVFLNTLLPQDMGGIGIFNSAAGLGIGLIILLPLYLLRAMGAGDIKLMAMIGVFVGPVSMLYITLYVLLAGGVLAIGVALLRRRLSRLTENLKTMLLLRLAGAPAADVTGTENLPPSAGKLPYGVAIAAGTFVHLAMTYWS